MKQTLSMCHMQLVVVFVVLLLDCTCIMQA